MNFLCQIESLKIRILYAARSESTWLQDETIFNESINKTL